MSNPTTRRSARPVPASIPMPDSPIRRNWAFQIFVRLPRPTLDWIGAAGAAWSLFLGDLLDKPMDDGSRVIVLTFVGALYGIRSYEKRSGVA
jgi:hypothetical protein